MFSSAQLEFLQQWLYAMGLTKEPISLPGSEWLIQPSDIELVTPKVIREASEFKNIVKV